jgi:hypothetical protein
VAGEKNLLEVVYRDGNQEKYPTLAEIRARAARAAA